MHHVKYYSESGPCFWIFWDYYFRHIDAGSKTNTETLIPVLITSVCGILACITAMKQEGITRVTNWLSLEVVELEKVP